MKILTLNTHSIQEPNYEEKLEAFVKAIARIRPDVIALQEVNQTADAAEISPEALQGQAVVCSEIQVCRDNHAARVAQGVQRAGLDCSWVWLPMKLGYGKYDEGVAILVLNDRITEAEWFTVSKADDYGNWRTRRVLGVQTEKRNDWFYTVHMGWWNDAEEPFIDQWNTLSRMLLPKRTAGRIWLMGDFNAPDSVPDESYHLIASSGWTDTYRVAERKDSGITVPGVIDGWRDKLPADAEGMRLDYIWCSRRAEISSSRVVFNGTNEPIVSDHFGVLIETKES